MKKAAVGNNITPIISAILFATQDHIVPYIISIITTGRKAKPILTIGVCIEHNLVNII